MWDIRERATRSNVNIILMFIFYLNAKHKTLCNLLQWHTEVSSNTSYSAADIPRQPVNTHSVSSQLWVVSGSLVHSLGDNKRTHHCCPFLVCQTRGNHGDIGSVSSAPPQHWLKACSESVDRAVTVDFSTVLLRFTDWQKGSSVRLWQMFRAGHQNHLFTCCHMFLSRWNFSLMLYIYWGNSLC